MANWTTATATATTTMNVAVRRSVIIWLKMKKNWNFSSVGRLVGWQLQLVQLAKCVCECTRFTFPSNMPIFQAQRRHCTGLIHSIHRIARICQHYVYFSMSTFFLRRPHIVHCCWYFSVLFRHAVGFIQRYFFHSAVCLLLCDFVSSVTVRCVSVRVFGQPIGLQNTQTNKQTNRPYALRHVWVLCMCT